MQLLGDKIGGGGFSRVHTDQRVDVATGDASVLLFSKATVSTQSVISVLNPSLKALTVVLGRSMVSCNRVLQHGSLHQT